jgi:hypothetical protein
LLGGVIPVAGGDILLNFPARRTVQLLSLDSGVSTTFGPGYRGGSLESVGASGLSAGEIWVFDDRRLIVAFFSRDGVPLRSVKVQPPPGMRFAAVLDDGRLLWLPKAGTYGRRDANVGRVAMMTGSDGSGPDTLLAIGRPLPRVRVMTSRGEIEVPNWLDDSPLLAVSPRARYLAVVLRSPTRTSGRDSVHIELVSLTSGGTEHRSFPYAVRQLPTARMDSLILSEVDHLTSHVGHGSAGADARLLTQEVRAALPAPSGWRTVRSILVNDSGDIVLEREYTDSAISPTFEVWRRNARRPVAAGVPPSLRVRSASDRYMFAVSRDGSGHCGLWVITLESSVQGAP